mmetsp:Transcript_26004/g.51873  ORF Transcript_26004/g.51873 Transcript_26004/m.51873 type:complete len:274 (+) Transcript_26004:472-1293(+)
MMIVAQAYASLQGAQGDHRPLNVADLLLHRELLLVDLQAGRLQVRELLVELDALAVVLPLLESEGPALARGLVFSHFQVLLFLLKPQELAIHPRLERVKLQLGVLHCALLCLDGVLCGVKLPHARLEHTLFDLELELLLLELLHHRLKGKFVGAKGPKLGILLRLDFADGLAQLQAVALELRHCGVKSPPRQLDLGKAPSLRLMSLQLDLLPRLAPTSLEVHLAQLQRRVCVLQTVLPPPEAVLLPRDDLVLALRQLLHSHGELLLKHIHPGS